MYSKATALVVGKAWAEPAAVVVGPLVLVESYLTKPAEPKIEPVDEFVALSTFQLPNYHLIVHFSGNR